jgi:hypothetical protein
MADMATEAPEGFPPILDGSRALKDCSLDGKRFCKIVHWILAYCKERGRAPPASQLPEDVLVVAPNGWANEQQLEDEVSRYRREWPKITVRLFLLIQLGVKARAARVRPSTGSYCRSCLEQ